MSTTNKPVDRQTVVSFSFWEFCQGVQDLIQKGYVFSDQNDDFPQAYVGNYQASLLKFEAVQVDSVPPASTNATSDVLDNQAQQPMSKVATKGRKPNVK